MGWCADPPVSARPGAALAAQFVAASAVHQAQVVPAVPIALNPDNPHYFQWRGRPTILITSAEHYGAVLNLDFDYRKYLDTLAADGMNYTRVFSGAYVEPEGAFKIARNTLAPRPRTVLLPGRAAARAVTLTAATSSILLALGGRLLRQAEGRRSPTPPPRTLSSSSRCSARGTKRCSGA